MNLKLRQSRTGRRNFFSSYGRPPAAESFKPNYLGWRV